MELANFLVVAAQIVACDSHQACVVRFGLKCTDANPSCGPTEQGIMLEISEMDGFGAIWIDSDAFENSDFRPWRTRALDLEIWKIGAPGTENPRF